MCVSVLYGMTRTKNQTLSFRRHQEREMRQIWNRYGRGEKNPDNHASQAKFFYKGTHNWTDKRKTIQSRDWFTNLSSVQCVSVFRKLRKRCCLPYVCRTLNCVCCRSHLEMIMDEMRNIILLVSHTQPNESNSWFLKSYTGEGQKNKRGSNGVAAVCGISPSFLSLDDVRLSVHIPLHFLRLSPELPLYALVVSTSATMSP